MKPSSIAKSRLPGTLAALFGLFMALPLLALAAAPALADAPLRVLAFGDSLTAGYGLNQGEGFADQLQAAFRKMGRSVTVINGGVSGDTSAGGLSRIDWALADRPQVVIVELGANDMLRGIDPANTQANLNGIVAKAKSAGAEVLLCGMKAQRNLGPDYVQKFDAIYAAIAKDQDVPLYPFFLDGIVNPDGTANKVLLQGDGLHPTAEGAALIVQRLMPTLLPLLNDAAANPS
ncbi:MAG TPA: arylesterase [Dongiaceae bacterium]